ncbi:hypothetical protein O3G_MSEX009718 [Manduca sexta]|uniref:PDZ domain-containing protein n=1 Tax=Manduca sexta TaxID=7130 RepID=A0A921ZEP9_MANSE|nr:hypothetical protein O3G_MSEX009718 [Manduca sexta]
MPMYQRPPFWRVPHMRTDPEDEPRYYGRGKVTAGTPAGKELVRGDIIAKIDDYDARDLRHEDAQNLFKNAPRQIKLVVQRGGSSPHLYTVPRTTGSFVGRVPTPTFFHEFADHLSGIHLS